MQKVWFLFILSLSAVVCPSAAYAQGRVSKHDLEENVGWWSYVQSLHEGQSIATTEGTIMLGAEVGKGLGGRVFFVAGRNPRQVIKFQAQDPAPHPNAAVSTEAKALGLFEKLGIDAPRLMLFAEKPGPILIKEFAEGTPLQSFFGRAGVQQSLHSKIEDAVFNTPIHRRVGW